MVETLDVVYVCKTCGVVLIFKEDMRDHQTQTGHSGIAKIPIGGYAEPA
ncbi:MAG: hypothetical protein AB1351_12585 [Thermoproteota archaeon]